MKGHIKNRSLMTGGMVTVLLSAMLCSCDSENFAGTDAPDNVCDNICFGISPDNNVRTRGNAADKSEEYTADRFVLRSDDSSDTLCVHTVISDGICLSGDETVTRGVPVDNTNFYDAFNVVAYWQKGGAAVNQFYLNDVARNNGSNIWSTGNVYYWPGAGHSFRFYAWAPTDAGLAAPADPSSTTLTYTVPDAAADQRDIVVATTSDIAGDHNTAVPLTFSHIATAVRFVVGSSMQPGTIESVSINGVKYSGSYDMSAAAWTLADDTKNFTQTLGKATTGNEADNDAITTPEGTFMMLPQTLPADAMVEVLFRNANGQERTLSAPIAGTEWPIGKTVTYKLSITPEYELNIDVPADPQDAHYITFPVTVNVKDYDGEWTLTSNLTSDVFFTAEKTELQQQGYWIDEDKGQPSVTGTGSGTFTYYVYVTENIGDAARDLEFRITPNAEGAETSTATVSQLCPSWNGNIGCERIEEKGADGQYLVYPWGFRWDRKVVYDFNSALNVFLPYFFESRFGITGDSYTGSYFTYTKERTGFLGANLHVNVSIDYLKLSMLTGADTENGLTNTEYLFNYAGAGGSVDELEQFCIDYTSLIGSKFQKTSEDGSSAMPDNYAAFEALLRNKFNKQIIGEGDEAREAPLLKPENMVWYLPSSSECFNLKDETYPLNGKYWSSNAVHDNASAWYYEVVNGSVSAYTDDRLTNYKVRAVRAKQ